MNVRYIVLFLMIMVSCRAYAASNPYVPPSGKALLFVGQDRDTISHYVADTGNVPGGTMFYTSIQEMKGLDKSNDYGAGPQDAQALLVYYPYSAIQVGLYMVDGLNKTIAGNYNPQLKRLAQWIKSANRPVYVRIGYEFDNPSNHYDPELYKQAFRYVVNFLRKEGVSNAAFVWHSYCADKPGQSWMDWYPGDEYVDWFAVSLFSTYQIEPAENFLHIAKAHHKPLMVAESTPAGEYSTRAKLEWLGHVFHFVEENNIEAFCYIDSNWDLMPMFQAQHWGDARVEQAPEIKDFWLKKIGQSRFLNSSPDLFRLLGWQH